VCIYDVVVSKRRTAGENFKGDNAKREVIGSVVVADMQQDFGCDVPFKKHIRFGNCCTQYCLSA